MENIYQCYIIFKISITLKMIKIGKRKHSNLVSADEKRQGKRYMKCVISNPSKIAQF